MANDKIMTIRATLDFQIKIDTITSMESTAELLKHLGSISKKELLEKVKGNLEMYSLVMDCDDFVIVSKELIKLKEVNND